MNSSHWNWLSAAYFSQKIGLDILCQILFAAKNKKKKNVKMMPAEIFTQHAKQ